MKKYKSADQITVGVIGYGGARAYSMGRVHIESARDAGMRPVAIAEIDPKRRITAREENPDLAVYQSVEEMFRKSDVELVVVVTPHNTHAKLIVQSLNTGRHVITEKPMALTTAECDRILATAKRNKRLATAFHNRHWDGCIMGAVRAVQKGTIGEVVRVSARMGQHGKPADTWRGSRLLSGGILYDWGVHCVEYALQILEGRIVEVTGFAHHGTWAAKSHWSEDANEDDAYAVVRFSSGQHFTLHMTSIDANTSPYWLEITGTKGSYLFNNDHFELVRPKGTGVQRTSGRNPQSNWTAFYHNIADYLTRKAPLIITPEWSRRPIHVIDLAVRSAKAGRTLRAKYG